MGKFRMAITLGENFLGKKPSPNPLKKPFGDLAYLDGVGAISAAFGT